jgi:iron complex outermembrane recepter protein
MKRTLLTAAVFSMLTAATFAQTQPVVEGVVKDKDGQAAVATTVALLKASDSTVIKSVAADKTGRYQLSVPANGKFLVSFTAVGHSKGFSKHFVVDGTNNSINLGEWRLAGISTDLKQVTVTSKKPLIEQKIDRTIINVEAAVSNTGANALEVLEKSPGVEVDKDGNISLKGKQGVMVLIDGRPAYLSGADLANMLRGMQASQLEQIEIMTNPPAKYDAAGNSGVINIRTKKNKMKGFNGNLTAGIGVGVYVKTNESINLNYRNGKVNMFGAYSFGYSEYFQELEIKRRFTNPDKSTRAIFEQVSFMPRSRSNNNLKVGMDYNLTKKTTVGFVASGFYNPETDGNFNTSYLKDPSSTIDSIVSSTGKTKEVWKNGSLNLNLRHQYDSTGRELTVDVDYIQYDASNEQLFVNTTFTPVWAKKYEEQLRGDLPISIKIYSGRMDYVLPLKKELKLEAGWKSSYVETDSRANYFELLDTKWSPDYGKTNFFEYKENINAAYINLNKQFTKKFGVQTGLRFENTNYKGYQYGNPTRQDSAFTNTYNSLFPTVYLNYKPAEANQFTLSFGRRIDRPDYGSLNPFLWFIDKYTYGQGNPYLKPQYSNNIELSHVFKGKFTTTLNYGITNNLFTETFNQEGEYATIVRRGNIGRRENAGIAISAQFQAGKWLSSQVYTNYNYSKFKGVLYGDPIEVEAGNFSMNVNNQLKFGKGWSAEVGGWFRSAGIEGQIKIKSMGQLNAGVAKQIMDGKASIRFNVRDILFTQQARGEIYFKSTEAHFINTRDTRVANLTFTYRFGKPINGNTQRKKSSATEEQNRVKSGD